MKEIKIFNNQLTVHISNTDWAYLCNNRFFTNAPTLDEIETEIAVGAGVYPSEKENWATVDEELATYINMLRQIRGTNL